MTAAASAVPWPTVLVDGVAIHAATVTGCAAHVAAQSAAGRGGWIITANLDHLRRAAGDPQYRRWLTEADIVTADGMPLLWAARLAGRPLPERVAGSDLVPVLAAEAARTGRSVALLGGDPGTADAAAAGLSASHPGLRVVGTHCPPFGFESSPDEMRRVERFVDRAAADIVLVGLGSPRQERLIAGLRARRPSAWWIGVGITFSFLCGRVPRAPGWMRVAGLEWLHRLVQEPRRLARRYLADGLPYAAGLLARAAAGRRSRPTHPSTDLI